MADFKWYGDTAKKAAREGIAKGLTLGAELILGESLRVVPLEEATLQKSGTTDVDERALEANISYDTPYAVRQHEDLSLSHDAGRTAKYLERPMTEHADKAWELIHEEVQDELKRQLPN